MRADLNVVSVNHFTFQEHFTGEELRPPRCLILGLAVWHSIGHLHVSVECLTEHSRSNLVCRICNILFLEFLIDSLNLPMLFPAKLVDMMSNSLHMKIIYCR